MRSNRGDAYQHSVALHWIVEMLLNDDITGVQVDVITTPNINDHVYGDDIVILFNNGLRYYIQAKVNQKEHKSWSLADPTFSKELIAAKKQLISDSNCQFFFYSRTPFGLFQRLIEEARIYPDFEDFDREVANNQKQLFSEINTLWGLEKSESFPLIKRIYIGDHHSSIEWQKYSLERLRLSFSKPKTALELVTSFIDRQHSKLDEPLLVIGKTDVISMLEDHGIYSSLSFDENEIIEKFKAFSLNGRHWVRTIDGEIITRAEVEKLKQYIHEGVPSVLLEDVAGGGKTCILLELMDYLEQQTHVVPLFIRGDLFASISSLKELSSCGLPSELLAQTARLADTRKVVFIIDSLDVLAVGRSHKSLQTFLALVGSLSKIPNITIIAASRAFDAKYDPLLREFSWSQKVVIEALSFRKHISPILVKRSINPNDVPDRLKELLVIPQNLRLFVELLRKDVSLSSIAEHDLFMLYIKEVVENDPILGQQVVQKLESIAIDLLKERSYEFHYSKTNLSAEQIQRLLSLQVLSEVNHQQLMFSHQTIADALRIQLAIRKNITLLEFVVSQPQLPFIRPSVRTFLTSLRNSRSNHFTKQVHQFLMTDSVSMHLKRLAVETLAEMPARDHDIKIVSLLSNHLPSLFGRFLQQATHEDWFCLLHDTWLQSLSYTKIQENAGPLLRYFSKFIHGHESEIIKIWNRAIDENWGDTKLLVWQITNELEHFKAWDAGGMHDLLLKLFNAQDGERDNLGKAICQCIEQTGTGDELLWRFITRDIDLEIDIKRGRDLKFNCQQHQLLNENFLEKRLKSSETLFSCAMDFLLGFAERDFPAEQVWMYDRILLDQSSYTRRHSDNTIRAHDSINELLQAVESAMKYRAKFNDASWQKYEPILRQTSDLGLRYLLCESYLINIADNINGITYQLTDREHLRQNLLEYELGILANKSFPYLSNSSQEIHQRLLEHLYDDVSDEDGWTDRSIYQRLVWIPGVYRLPEVQRFIDKCEIKYGKGLPKPAIPISGGWIQSPVGHEKLIELNHDWLLRLFEHYNDYNDWHEARHDGLFGGRESLESALRVAASLLPIHFLTLAEKIDKTDLKRSYIESIIEGVATHIRCRFGNLSDSSWQPIEPLPEGTFLGKSLLDLIDRSCFQDLNGYTYSSGIEACSTVLTDNDWLDRLSFHYWRLGLHADPELSKDIQDRDLIGAGINSVRGRAVDSLVSLCNHKLDNGDLLPDILMQLLERYAKDPSMVVRATFLRRFPYFHYKNIQFGWQLVGQLTHKCSAKLLPYLEQTLYYRYHEDFASVKVYLDLIKSFNHADSNQAWGKLMTLSYLSDHVQEAEFWHEIASADESMKTGVGKVFVANISSTKSTSKCVNGLLHMFKIGLPKIVYRKLNHFLSNKDNIRYISLPLVQQFISSITIENMYDIDDMFGWTEYHVASIPEEVLNLLETVICRLNELAGTQHIYFHRQESLITTLKYLLQEADLTDDSDFIERVLDVQYWFLDKGLKELEEMYEAN